MWWTGTNVPGSDSVAKLADKLGIEVYDVLGLPKPNENLFYITKHFEKAPEKVQRAIKEQIEKYAGKNE